MRGLVNYNYITMKKLKLGCFKPVDLVNCKVLKALTVGHNLQAVPEDPS